MKISLLQTSIEEDEGHNLERLLSLYLKAQGDVALAPELSLGGYLSGLNLEFYSQAQKKIACAVKQKRVPLIVGYPLLRNNELYNTALMFTSENTILLGGKRALFPLWDPQLGFSPFPETKPFIFKGWCWGILICFDLRFPEIAKRLCSQGAEILLVLAQWPKTRIEHFKALLKARAIENQSFVIAVNATGKIKGEILGGRSIAFDPQGIKIASLEDKPGILEIELNKQLIKETQAVFNTSKDLLLFSSEEKILTWEELQKERNLRALKGQKMVFTNGCFDIFHAGHASYLYEARKKGDFLVVGINSDNSLRRLKGKKRPIIPQKQRALIIASLAWVDYVTFFNEDTPLKLIKALKPDILVKGADWPEEKIVGADWVKSYGGKICRIPFVYQISTSQIINKIKNL